MAKRKAEYVCVECGYVSSTWLGRCPACGTWDSFVEREDRVVTGADDRTTSAPVKPLQLLKVQVPKSERVTTGLKEVDRVLGGALTIGSAILLGGEPGIGKSTLALQIAHAFSSRGMKVLYVSAEESATQVRLRYERLFGHEISPELYLLEKGKLEDILNCSIEPLLIIVDSIQAVYTERLDAPPSSLSQVKNCAQELINYTKSRNITSIMLAHVTKSGIIAGPKYLEHMVDVVLMLERFENYHILRATKNRFGPLQEVGLIELTSKGFRDIDEYNWLQGTDAGPGVTLFPLVQGARVIPLELQALVSRSYTTQPRRLYWGTDPLRMDVLVTLLEKHLGLGLHKYDIIFNVSGALKLYTQDADLAIVATLLSALRGVSLENRAFLGRVSLQGKVLPVTSIELRIAELKRRGLRNVFISSAQRFGDQRSFKDIQLFRLSHIKELSKLLITPT